MGARSPTIPSTPADAGCGYGGVWSPNDQIIVPPTIRSSDTAARAMPQDAGDDGTGRDASVDMDSDLRYLERAPSPWRLILTESSPGRQAHFADGRKDDRGTLPPTADRATD